MRKILKIISKSVTYITFLCLLNCTPNRNLLYFKDLNGFSEHRAQVQSSQAIKIQPNDLIDITVNSLNLESNILFNNGVLSNFSSTNNSDLNAASSVLASRRESEGYLVNKDGFINFPVLGLIKLSDLTKEEATQKMTKEISKYIKVPMVSIKLINFRITVIGEVNQPSSFRLSQENVNIFEALGLAGDMTIYGNRESVLIIRETAETRTATRIDLSSKDILGSPYYYLRQNDIVYVEPVNHIKIAQNNPNNRLIPIWASIISTIGFAIITLTK